MIKEYNSNIKSPSENTLVDIKSYQGNIGNHILNFAKEITIQHNGNYQKLVVNDGYILIVALVNDIRLDLFGFKWKINQNQSFIYYVEAGTELIIECSDEEIESTFYFLSLNLPSQKLEKVLVPNILEKENRLNKICRHQLFNIYLGKFGLTKKGELPLKKKDRSWIVFSLDGVFTIYNQYLEHGNVLHLNTNEFISFESLSTESLIMAIEF